MDCVIYLGKQRDTLVMLVLRSFHGRRDSLTYYGKLTKQMNTMSERALKNGDPLPPVTKDKMRFYNMRFCPFAQRTRIVLLHKKIPHEMVNLNLRYKPDWFLARNPSGLVPVLEYQGEIVYESLICNDYLENMFPRDGDGCLYSNSPAIRARQSILMHLYDTKVTMAIYGVLDADKAVKGRESVNQGLQMLEEALAEKKYFGGDKPCMVDYHVYPWFERFPAVTRFSKLILDEVYEPLPADVFPRLCSWLSRIQALPAVKQTILPTEYHTEYITKFKMKEPEYDIGLPVAATL